MWGNGDSDREAKNMVYPGWNRWRKTTGILCYRRTLGVKPAMMYGLESAAMTKKHDIVCGPTQNKVLFK